ncbi:hypothetical protein ACFLUF_02870 [Chloroflexota bacterium]
MHKKRAQGLSIRTIILAVIGLIVLVVLIAIFTRETGENINVLKSCEARGGICIPKDGPCGSGKIIPGLTCPTKDEICCYKIE